MGGGGGGTVGGLLDIPGQLGTAFGKYLNQPAPDDTSVEERKAADDLKKTLSQRVVSGPADNFLATKNAKLQQLQMGLASTFKIAGSSPLNLNKPSLLGSGGGKTKTGQ